MSDILTQAVPTSWNGAGPAGECLVIEAGALDRPIQVPGECCPPSVAPVINDPGVALKDAASAHDGALVGHEISNMVGVYGSQGGHQRAEALCQEQDLLHRGPACLPPRARTATVSRSDVPCLS